MELKTVTVLMFSIFQCCSSNMYQSYSSSDGVLLAVSKINAERIQLKLRNEGATPIFLGYRILDEQANRADIGYRLVCYQGDVEKDFGPEHHSGVGLLPLDRGDELEFEVNPIPKFKRNCYVSVGYYKDEKAVEIVKRVVSMSAPIFSPEEEKFLEQSKQKAIVTVNLNNEE